MGGLVVLLRPIKNKSKPNPIKVTDRIIPVSKYLRRKSGIGKQNKSLSLLLRGSRYLQQILEKEKEQKSYFLKIYQPDES